MNQPVDPGAAHLERRRNLVASLLSSQAVASRSRKSLEYGAAVVTSTGNNQYHDRRLYKSKTLQVAILIHLQSTEQGNIDISAVERE